MRRVVAAVAAALVAGCTSPAAAPVAPRATSTSNATPALAGTAGPCGTRPTPPARWDHVVWIWMENHRFGDVIGSRAAPYTTALAARCATASNWHTVGRPSLPNYIGATSGDTWGIGDDAGPATHRLTVDNLFRQVRTAGGTERSYEEAMPVPCDAASPGRYAVKHNPAAYFAGDSDRSACQRDDLPLPDQLGSPLPTFTFVTPDLCHDTHDCRVGAGDTWLAGWLPGLLAGPDFQSGATVVVIVWDEPSPVPNVVISPSTPGSTRLTTRVDHYALLRLTEELLGLPLLGRAAQAPDIRAALGL